MGWLDQAMFGALVGALAGLYGILFRVQWRLTRIETYLFDGIISKKRKKEGANEENKD